MRILLLHGYLLRGTGSNVYTAQLARALVAAGHEVHLVCQERRPDEIDGIDAAGDWDAGELRVEVFRRPVRCTVYRPDIAGLLPVYVPDRYDDVEARPFPDLGDGELDRYLQRNVDAVGEVADRVQPDLALAGHLVMAPVVAARALARRGVPYAVKVHGSALEYTVKADPSRFLPFAHEGLRDARCVLVGSRHTAESLWAAMDDRSLPGRTRLGPPGVDVHRFAPRADDDAAAGIRALARRLADRPAAGAPAPASAADPGVAAPAGPLVGPPAAETGLVPAASVFDRDLRAIATALGRIDPARPLVAYVGKLIVSKGVDLLAAAWPLVRERVPDATLVVVGFGAWRAAFEGLLAALAEGDLEAVRRTALDGRAAEGGPRTPLRHLLAFLDGLEGPRRDGYLAAAREVGTSVVVVGRLEHDELAELLPACRAQVVPSTFPEAFGMVAAEAAACGVLPVSARHSGLAEVSTLLAAGVPEDARPLLTFGLDDAPVEQLADRVAGWLLAPATLRADTRDGLVRVARERFSWEGVAEGVVAAAEGRLDHLAEPPPSG